MDQGTIDLFFVCFPSAYLVGNIFGFPFLDARSEYKKLKAHHEGTIKGQMEMFPPPKLWEMYKQKLKP